ncbi:MAG: 1-(5-phosphoribosyl)-5-[(5-phosphoribosylamino)methylideneamino]imidazole-4-carboxamide isomerase [Bacteroidota bacterium]|jgi:phosphoribosylformimino-5-aminoimidazole carboxamide ribotide isomerase
MEIIPAIDIIDGKCVRLTEGNYASKTVYEASPLEMAKQYESLGFKRLHLVDLDGAKAGKVTNWKIVEDIAAHTQLVLDFGGGVKTSAEVKRIIDLGVQYVTVGSIAAKHPEEFKNWLISFGTDKFFLGADVRDNKIMTGGWLDATEIDVMNFIEDYMHLGVNHFFCTDISKDGKLMGPSIDLYRSMIESLPGLHLVASGGVSSMEDLQDLKAIGCKGAIVGKAIYEGKIDLKVLSSFNVQ